MTTIDCVRCKFTKSDGLRCKRNTCVRKDYCWQHLRAVKGVDIRPSTLPGAGTGLVAFRNFRKGEKVAAYSGNLVSAVAAHDSQYAVAWKNGEVVNASSSQHSIGRYANTCRSADKRGKKCNGNNVKLSRDFTRRKISLKATKRIKRGNEIFASYGAGFRIVR